MKESAIDDWSDRSRMIEPAVTQLLEGKHLR